MRFLKREPSPPGIADFWTWWPENRDRIAMAITSSAFDDRLVQDISAAVRTIHPAMAWELGPGRTAEHAFCVSPEGNPVIRQAALRWLAAAPPADATWEYYPSKQAAASMTGLKVGGVHFDLDEMRAITAWDSARQRADLTLWHPAFASVPEAIRIQVGFLFLDNLLGEDDVERWVGQLDFGDAPTEGLTPAELKAEIERRSAEGGDDRWVVSTRTRPDGMVEIAVADASLKRIDHPFADRHAIVRILPGDERWLPTAEEGAVLTAEEEDLERRLEGIAIFAGRTTVPGQRALHFVAEDTDLMRPAIDAWAAALPDSLTEGAPPRRLKVDFGTDMDWSFQKELGVR
ncbi:MAG TPA: hypothetical protein VFW86_04540 [Candidatus Limnocylindrales bacterium]|nr:hypothetical protein [Candidatus Limnocylindrales bacterium]